MITHRRRQRKAIKSSCALGTAHRHIRLQRRLLLHLLTSFAASALPCLRWLPSTALLVRFIRFIRFVRFVRFAHEEGQQRAAVHAGRLRHASDGQERGGEIHHRRRGSHLGSRLDPGPARKKVDTCVPVVDMPLVLQERGADPGLSGGIRIQGCGARIRIWDCGAGSGHVRPRSRGDSYVASRASHLTTPAQQPSRTSHTAHAALHAALRSHGFATLGSRIPHH